MPAATARVVVERDDEDRHVMNTPLDVNRYIPDHLCRWSRTGRDGACLDGSRMNRRADQQPPSGINPGVALGHGTCIVSPDQYDPCQLRRRSAPAALSTTTKSP